MLTGLRVRARYSCKTQTVLLKISPVVTFACGSD